MRTRILAASAGLALMLGACADNYAVEGAALGAAAGAGVAAIADKDIATGAAIGAAAGGVAGYFVDRDNDCDGWSDGRWDSDCRGRDGYPD